MLFLVREHVLEEAVRDTIDVPTSNIHISSRTHSASDIIETNLFYVNQSIESKLLRVDWTDIS